MGDSPKPKMHETLATMYKERINERRLQSTMGMYLNPLQLILRRDFLPERVYHNTPCSILGKVFLQNGGNENRTLLKFTFDIYLIPR